jgi:hypothetical protein
VGWDVEGAAAEGRSIAGRRRGVSGDRCHSRRQAEETGSIGAARALGRRGCGEVAFVSTAVLQDYVTPRWMCPVGGDRHPPCPGGKVAA